MTSTGLPAPCCDNCHRTGKKIHRVHRGRRFCSTCYSRLFKRSLCRGCRNFARIYTLDTHGLCLSCEAKAPCVRCSAVGKPIGLMTEYGPACNSCAHYFKAPEPCGRCGTLSTRLTRVSKKNDNVRYCPRCARDDAGTCPDCRRHRFLILGADGRLRCKLCTENGESQCLTCSRPMPAGRGKECDDCTWKKTFERRVRIQIEGYDRASVRKRFAEFCEWLCHQMGPRKAALKLKHYLVFFSFLDTHSVELPSYVSLLNHFEADGLRRMRTPMLWLNERYGIQPDATMREEHSDKRRIEEMINSMPSGAAQTALSGYRAYLMSRQGQGKTTIRSVRLSIRAARDLLAAGSELLVALPAQQAVTDYLTHKPGQRASSLGFIAYLNRTYELDLNADVSKRAQSKARGQRLEADIHAMYDSREQGEAFERNWIKTALMLFHKLPRVSKKMISYTPFTVEGQCGYNVALNGKTYWVPGPRKPLDE